MYPQPFYLIICRGDCCTRLHTSFHYASGNNTVQTINIILFICRDCTRSQHHSFYCTSNTIFVVYCTIRVYGRQVLQLLATSASATTKIDNTVRIEIVCISTRLHSSVTPQAPALKLNCPLSLFLRLHSFLYLPPETKKDKNLDDKKKRSKAKKIRSNQIGHQLETNCASWSCKLELQLQ